MEAPKRIRPKSLANYLEVMTKAVFQSGISWQVVEAKWDGFQRALAGFDPEAVAALTPRDVDRLMKDASIIRNRRKLEATIDNAVEMLALEEEHGSFKRYLRSHGVFEETVADLKSRFRFLGDLGAYYFLYVVGEKVPPHEEWRAAHPASGARGSSARAKPLASAKRPRAPSRAKAKSAAASKRRPSAAGRGTRAKAPAAAKRRPRTGGRATAKRGPASKRRSGDRART
jgi:hypothetical protein